MKREMTNISTLFRKMTRALKIFAISLTISLTNSYAQTDSSVAVQSVAPSAGGGGLSTDPAVIKAGETLFKANCKSCHAMDKKLVGPALQGVTERRDQKWLVSWINNAPKMIQDGDPIATELFNEYKSVMTSFQSFKEDEILSVLSYVKAWQPEVATVAGPDNNGSNQPVEKDDTATVVLLSVVIVVLVLLIIVLILLSAVLVKTLKEKEASLSDEDKELVNQTHSISAVVKSPAFIGIVVTLGLIVGGLWFLKGVVYNIGVQQAYAPEQPIPFSHKIHAGDHEIDCNYCHTGVRKSKNANIPSANICMNCHSEIKTDSKYIKQIHEAIDYNAETKTYGKNQKPIKWVRVHNLPDLAYFNHSQHVKVGGLECENCHGPIKEMDVVRQYSPLTMGWCIDCHRKTAVDGDNAYYDKLMQVHSKESKEPMTVENIGGLECSKCHY